MGAGEIAGGGIRFLLFVHPRRHWSHHQSSPFPKSVNDSEVCSREGVCVWWWWWWFTDFSLSPTLTLSDTDACTLAIIGVHIPTCPPTHTLTYIF